MWLLTPVFMSKWLLWKRFFSDTSPHKKHSPKNLRTKQNYAHLETYWFSYHIHSTMCPCDFLCCHNNPGQLSLWDLEARSILSVLSLDAHVGCMRLLRGREIWVLLGLSHSPALISIRPTSRNVSSATQASRDGDLFGESSSSEEEEDS